MKVQKKLPPGQAFQTTTSFAVKYCSVIKSMYPGCIEVQLANWDSSEGTTRPGGDGLIVARKIDVLDKHDKITGAYAIIAGFSEVFTVVDNYNGNIILRPVGVFGSCGERYRCCVGKTSRKRRLSNKYRNVAARSLRRILTTMRPVTDLPDRKNQCSPYSVFVEIKVGGDVTGGSTNPARTMEEAKLGAKRKVQRLKDDGWACTEGTDHNAHTWGVHENTVSWVCKKDGVSKLIQVRCRCVLSC